ncbi:hypothetical protein [Yoonia sp.]|uniref:hypothetical protein n=1 Tax=Yoonia sp. TaxID=2212373 RepID=UPI002DF8118A|nr:hypothetical protein [Yoonia sp.]
MARSKLDSLIFIDATGDAKAHAEALEKAVKSAAAGDNLVYAKFVKNLSGLKATGAKALDLAERGLVSLTTIKAQKDPTLWHYVAQRSKRKYEKKGGDK